MFGLITPTNACRFQQALQEEPVVAVDTETTGLDIYGRDVIRGYSIAGEKWSAYVPVSHPDTYNYEFMSFATMAANRMVVMHHAVFDWGVFAQAKYGPHEDMLVATIYDTQVGNWLIDENLKVGLKESAERYLGFDAGAEKRALKALTKETGRTWDTFTGEDIAEYAAMDARLTWDLWQWQMHYLGHDHEEFMEAMRREMEVQRALFYMNRRGIAVDKAKLVAHRHTAVCEMVDIAERLPINPASPKQVATWLFDECGYEPTRYTKTGAPSTDKNVLADMVDYSPEAEILLQHRTLQKEISAYYTPLIERCGEDGRVHPHFSSTRTVTGRLSCSGPNLQTIPRSDVMGGVRECFVPAEGWELWEFDLDQAELRVIAGYADEPAMIDALLDPERNLHKETATAMFGPDYTGLQYRFAKNLNYGFPYGIGPAKFATYINPVPSEADIREAAKVLQGYRETYPNVVRLMKRLEEYAKEHGKVPIGHTPGRYRHFKGPGYIVEGYTALNACVQGGIGEFMKSVMIDPGLKAPYWRPCLQIHDALVFEVRPGWADVLHTTLQGIADDLNPFDLPMIFSPKEWK